MRQRHAVKKVCICRPMVDPGLPDDWAEDGDVRKDGAYEKDAAHVRELGPEERQQRQVKAHVAGCGVRLERPDRGEREKSEEERSVVEADEEGRSEQHVLRLEHKEEEVFELREHLGEEVPVQPEVWSVVGNEEDEAVRGARPAPRIGRRCGGLVPQNGEREADENGCPRSRPRADAEARGAHAHAPGRAAAVVRPSHVVLPPPREQEHHHGREQHGVEGNVRRGCQPKRRERRVPFRRARQRDQHKRGIQRPGGARDTGE
mmetsp:Transcript_19929/g.64888  ORF Transcript_19929/g.64888 Transcript_19929/m.64888 type:complete len:261 (-) Transcript_19929:297-1079(-)